MADMIEKVRHALAKYDITVAYCNSEIERREKTMSKYEGSKFPVDVRRFLFAKNDKHQYEVLRDEMIKSKEKLTNELNAVLDSHCYPLKKVFWEYFIHMNPIPVVAEKLRSSEAQIESSVRQLEDLFGEGEE